MEQRIGRKVMSAEIPGTRARRLSVREAMLIVFREHAHRTFTAEDLHEKLHGVATRLEIQLSLRRLCVEGSLERVVRGRMDVAASFRLVVPPDDDRGFPRGAA
jgi:predicted transcriptional regulator of viral defense system